MNKQRKAKRKQKKKIGKEITKKDRFSFKVTNIYTSCFKQYINISSSKPNSLSKPSLI